MAESSLSCFDFFHNITGIISDFFEKCLLLYPAFGDISKFHLPVCCQFRLAQLLRYQLQKLFCLGGQVDFISFLFHQETVKKLLYDIRPCCNCSKSACFPKGLGRFRIMAFHIPHRILHCSKKCSFCKSCRWFCLTCIHRYIFNIQLLAFFHLRKLLVLQKLSFLCRIKVFLLCIRIFIYFFPTRTFYNFSAGRKHFSCCYSFHTYLLINKRGIQYT